MLPLPTPLENARTPRLAAMVLSLGLAGTLQAQLAPAEICRRDSTGLEHAADLYCMDLVPVPALPSAMGAVELRRPSSLFGAAVTQDGRHAWDLRLTVSGLPEPRTLGNYATYVAWATTPAFDVTVKLGEVGNGRFVLPRIALNTFLIIISAEESAAVPERSGRIVLRASSPSGLMRPLDFTVLPPRIASGEHAHAQGSADGWVMPKMDPAVPVMIPGLELLRPSVAPFRPRPASDPASLPLVKPRSMIAVKDGDSLTLTAMMARRPIAGRFVVVYGFNGEWPGPLIRVDRAATIVVNFVNRLDMPTAVHWHGIRLDNRFDGVPHVTQEPVSPGESFRYVIRFPDAGVYWYHPHHREDIQQDLGLYGNLLVRSDDPDFFAPAHREEVLMLDDFLVADGVPVPHGAEAPSHALMGRFGNVLLVNGEPSYRLAVNRGEVVRFYLTNAANTRPFNVSIDGARMKLVAGDVGKPEREEWVESVVLAPAERWVIDARFDRPGRALLLNRVQAIDHARGFYFPDVDTLGVVTVRDEPAEPDLSASFGRLRANADVVAGITRLRPFFDSVPSKRIQLTMRAPDLPFGLVQAMRLDTGFVNPVEWSGTMPMMDWLSTGRDVTWVLRDADTGKENMDIGWTFTQGDVVRMRLANDRHTLHPMQHPIHVHGQRFLVLAQNGIPNQNLVWKDTFLLPVGWTADILVEMSNPGRWMLHCHIAEHLEAGMHTVFTVLPAANSQ